MSRAMHSAALNRFFRGLLAVVLLGGNAGAVERPALKALFITGGGYHDYERLVPHLTTHLSALVHVTFAVKFDLDALKSPHFADAYDLVVYDVCFDEADGALLDNALSATRAGKPAVMIHSNPSPRRSWIQRIRCSRIGPPTGKRRGMNFIKRSNCCLARIHC